MKRLDIDMFDFSMYKSKLVRTPKPSQPKFHSVISNSVAGVKAAIAELEELAVALAEYDTNFAAWKENEQQCNNEEDNLLACFWCDAFSHLQLPLDHDSAFGKHIIQMVNERCVHNTFEEKFDILDNYNDVLKLVNAFGNNRRHE